MSAAVNAATAQGYINDVRDRVRRVLVNEQAVLQAVLDQWVKERTEAVDALGAFKTLHGIVALDEQRSQTEDDLNRAAAASPLVSQSGATRLTYVAEPPKSAADIKKVNDDQAALKKELARLDALVLEYQRLNGRYLAALSAYQQAFNAVKEQAAKIEGINGDALARVAVPPTDDESLVKKQPAKAKVMAIVVLASLVLSVLVCVVLELLDWTVKTRREFERLSGLPVLAEVKSKPSEADKEQWATAATLMELGTSGRKKVFLLVKPSALKTDVSEAVQLATAFARNGKDVLMVSAGAVKDWGARLEQNGGRVEWETKTVFKGLTSWAAEVGENEFSVGTAPTAFNVLQAADEVGYDVVLIETAALTDSAEALNVAARAGVYTVLVSGLRQTKREDVVDALQKLDRVKANVAGAVIFEK